jgi:hypothetical protein
MCPYVISSDRARGSLTAGECVVEDTTADTEREVQRLAAVLYDIHLLTANIEDCVDLARLLVARGVRAGWIGLGPMTLRGR